MLSVENNPYICLDGHITLIMIGGNIGFTAGTLLLVAGLVLIIVSSLRPAGIQVSSDSLVITGSYKYSVELGEIRSVERLDSLPKIKRP